MSGQGKIMRIACFSTPPSSLERRGKTERRDTQDSHTL